MKGTLAAAAELKSPVILGTSEGESKFFGIQEAVAMRNFMQKKYDLPVFLNLDHGKSFDYIKLAIDSGYDMVHFDGSNLALEENIKITKQVKNYAKWRGVLVEGEVGKIDFEAKEENLTSPKEAEKYSKEAKPDLLAISIGNFHGARGQKSEPNLRLDRFEEIKKACPEFAKGFVLHGGSGIEEDIKKAIGLGVVKININTEIRMAFTSALKQSLAEEQDEIAPYKYLPKAKEAVKMAVERKIELFGSKNHG
jgi:fructose-bisphosphate aldolase class II